MLAQTINNLSRSFHGKIIEKGGDEYNTARVVYYGMIDKHPAAIAFCHDVNDVIN